MNLKNKTLLIALFAVISVTTLGVQTFAKALDGGRAGMSPARSHEVTERKAAILQRLTDMREVRKEKLQSRRLEICQKHQDKINEIVTHGTEQNKKHLAVFQKIADNVKQFYADKNLSSDGYLDAVVNVDAAEADAVAAIEVSAETTFDCLTTDATNPGSVIKEAMTTRHSKLAEFRTAIKNLILVVKKANGSQTDTAEASAPSTNDTEEK